VPYTNPQQLVLMYEQLASEAGRFDLSAPDFEIVRGAARSYTGMAASRNAGYELTEGFILAFAGGVLGLLLAYWAMEALLALVSQQTHEIGVRVALGASAASVIWTVLRRALVLMAIGVGIGLAGAFALTRVMSGLLCEVRPNDAATFVVAALTLAAIALAAGLVPAWRATRVDPLVALRTE
jgi:ABC-type antimicrobial peptide transport system permease subunit